MKTHTEDDLSRAATSFWCYEALGCLTANQLRVTTPELLSRINCVLEAFCLFDRVTVAEECFRESKELLNDLDPENKIVEIIASANLQHGQTLLQNRITMDRSLFERAAPALEKTSDAWYFEHLPEISSSIDLADPDDPILAGAKIFHLLRLWQWSHCKEMSQVTNATVLLPNSLQGIGRYDAPPGSDLFVAKIDEVHTKVVTGLRDIDAHLRKRPQIVLEHMPPLLALFVDLYIPGKGAGEPIRKLRAELEDIRELRRRCESAIRDANTFAEKSEIVSDWSSKWKRVCDAKFKRPSLLRSDVSGGDIAKGAFDAMELKAGAVVSVAAKIFEYVETRKAFRQYMAYTSLHDRVGNLLLEENVMDSLQSKFEIQRFSKANLPAGD